MGWIEKVWRMCQTQNHVLIKHSLNIVDMKYICICHDSSSYYEEWVIVSLKDQLEIVLMSLNRCMPYDHPNKVS